MHVYSSHIEIRCVTRSSQTK